MVMENRSWQAGSTDKYRFGFKGKEKDDETYKGSLAFELRIFDSRICRWLSTDPREGEYAWQSTYAYYGNSPISMIDYLGGGGPYEDESTSVEGQAVGSKPPTSTKEEALSRLNELTKNMSQSCYFTNTTPKEFIDQMTNRVTNPSELNQGKGTNFCWAAQCLSYVYEKDPKGMVDAMVSLYTGGTFSYCKRRYS